MKFTVANNKKIFMIGFGSVGPTALTLILRHVDISPKQVEVVADNDVNRIIAERHGVKFVHFKISPENYVEFFSSRLNENAIVLNLSVGVSSLDLIALCQEHNSIYMDTGNEPWRYQTIASLPTTTYERRQKFLKAKTKYATGPTALMYHGANPGLVTHFAKRAMLDIANNVNETKIENSEEIDWGLLAYNCGVTAMHISELDTQRAKHKRGPHEYVNTWSIEGFLEEALECVGFAFGTNEIDMLHQNVRTRVDTKNCRVIELKHLGANTQLKSWVPSIGTFNGYMIPHPESFSIAELFSQKLNRQLYHPTVHFVYQPCQDAVSSMRDVAREGRINKRNKRLLVDEIIDGMDELGILILRKQTSEIYWYGSQLDINEARTLLPGNNATTIQVAAGVLSGLVWIIENPRRGLVEPEQIDFERALEVASPYLGKLRGHWSKWPDKDARKTTSEALNEHFLWSSQIVR